MEGLLPDISCGDHPRDLRLAHEVGFLGGAHRIFRANQGQMGGEHMAIWTVGMGVVVDAGVRIDPRLGTGNDPRVGTHAKRPS